jgi:multidrug resistance protein, MATE family
MKKGLLASYVDGIRNGSDGEKYSTIFNYFLPEFISALVLYSLVIGLDDYFIGQLESTSIYAAIGLTNGTLMHLVTKIAEGLSIGAIVLCGQYNGARRYDEVGYTLADTFWLSAVVGVSIAALFYGGAYSIYYYYGFNQKMIAIGVPFLRVRSLAIFFSFIYFAFVSFLRGVKNTRIPMVVFALGSIVFAFFDYALIFGKCGFPQLGYMGSAWASVIQYSFMVLLIVSVLFIDNRYRRYMNALYTHLISWQQVKQLINLSWPVVIDKATMAFAYVWLSMMIASMGKYGIASFNVIKNMERFAFLPSIALSQVITFIASNNYGSGDFDVIKINIKKTLFLASIFVFSILAILSYDPAFFIQFIVRNGKFTPLAAQVFPILSVLVFFDLLQLILSGALRGVSDVRTVMWTRLVIVLGCFMPLSYILSKLPIDDQVLKFTLIFGSFYICNGFMSLLYINRFRSGKWKLEHKGA